MRKAAIAVPLVLLALAGCKIQSDGSDASSSPSATATTPAPNPSGTGLTVTPDQARQVSQSLASLVNGPGKQLVNAVGTYLAHPSQANLNAVHAAGKGFTSAANSFADTVGGLDWPANAKDAADALVTSLKNAATTVGEKVQQVTPQNLSEVASAVTSAISDVVAKAGALAGKLNLPGLPSNLPSVPVPTNS